MGHDTVTIERRDTTAIVRFDRRGRANAIDFAMMEALTEVARGFEGDTRTTAAVLLGAPNIFCGGMDLRDPAFARLDDMCLAELRALADHGTRLARAWAQIEFPTIAAVEGPCIGGGMVIAAVCDFRVAGRGARFGAPEIAIGLNMAWQSVPRLIDLVGAPATRRLLLLGEEWDGAEARRLGFVDRVCEDGTAFDEALAMAEMLGARPAVATRMAKRQIDAAAHGHDWMSSATDKDQQVLAWLSEDFRATLKRFRDA